MREPAPGQAAGPAAAPGPAPAPEPASGSASGQEPEPGSASEPAAAAASEPGSAGQRPLRADARRNRAKVLAAAEQVLARDGAAASVREIARRAGVGLATIYRQFPTKEALYEAVVVAWADRLLERARAAARSPEPGEAFFSFVTFAVADSTGEKALVDSLADAGLDPKAGTGALYAQLERLTEVLLRRAQDAGAVRPDLGMAEVLALIAAACLAADRQRWDEPLRTRALAVIFDGMRPQRRPSLPPEPAEGTDPAP